MNIIQQLEAEQALDARQHRSAFLQQQFGRLEQLQLLSLAIRGTHPLHRPGIARGR